MKKKSDVKKFFRGFLSEVEASLLKKQIQFNSKCIDHYIKVIDLLVNKEKCPKDANTLVTLRERLKIMIDESDTFRRVLWNHNRHVNESYEEGLDAVSFLVGQIKSRRQALIAQLAMK